jgi:pimeloyl-ACP methyl ester carboxylesterase
MTDDRLTVGTADGRRLDAMVAGPPGGLPLIFHHGTPSGLVPLQPLIEAATARALRTVLYSRPGYGGSTVLPGRSVADAAADVTAILDALDAPTFVTAGWSGGGPHALACAAQLPGRCLAVASIAGVAPRNAGGLDWMAGMGPENIAEFSAADRGREAISEYLEAEAAGLRDVSAAEVAHALGGLVSDADKAVLAAGLAGYLAAAFRAALTQGIAGWRDDDLAFAKPWGFQPEDVRTDVRLWQGELDVLAPRTHGEYVASRLPNATFRLLEGGGHFLDEEWGVVFDWLRSGESAEQPVAPTQGHASRA